METMKITPGAGVDPRMTLKPGKRLRNWHRKGYNGQSLRQFARMLAKQPNGPERGVAARWLGSKGARP